VYVPVFPQQMPASLSHEATWQAFASLRDRVEQDGDALGEIRGVFAPLEGELWAEADAIAAQPRSHSSFAETAWRRVEAALSTLVPLPSSR
jgi:hypothetical protein